MGGRSTGFLFSIHTSVRKEEPCLQFPSDSKKIQKQISCPGNKDVSSSIAKSLEISIIKILEISSMSHRNCRLYEVKNLNHRTW